MSKLISVLNRLAVKNITDSGGWVNFSCPLAPYSSAHGFTEDKHPSAGAKESDDGHYNWNCFCCGAKGRLSSLVKVLARNKGVDYTALLTELEVEKSYADFDTIEYTKPEPANPVYLTEYVYSMVFEDLPQVALNYLNHRGITKETSQILNLRYSSNANRIIFPYYDNVGIVGYSGRSIMPNPHRKILNSEFDKSTVLYGQHLWTNKPTVLVEGLFALAKAYQLLHKEYDVAALSGTSLSAHQANILLQKNLPVTLFLDGDSAGIAGTKIIGDRLKHELSTFSVVYSEVNDIDLLTDAEVFDKVRNAKLIA